MYLGDSGHKGITHENNIYKGLKITGFRKEKKKESVMQQQEM